MPSVCILKQKARCCPVNLSKLAECLPNISKENATKACYEWTKYRDDENGNIKRIDHYWNEVLSRKTAAGMLKFPTVKNIVTSTLSLFHGNVDVESSFNINKNLRTAERTLLSEEKLNGLRITRDDASKYDGDIIQVSITKNINTDVKKNPIGTTSVDLKRKNLKWNG